jgi:prevent-host-death family protein
MRSIGAFEAKTHLSSLLDEAERGEEIVITKHGRPVARLVPPHPAGESPGAELVAWLKAFRRGRRLDGVSLKALIEEGRR